MGGGGGGGGGWRNNRSQMGAYLSLTLTPLYDSCGISTVENSNGYVFLSYNSPGTSSSRTAQK
jgi:hypothetical protein